MYFLDGWIFRPCEWKPGISTARNSKVICTFMLVLFTYLLGCNLFLLICSSPKSNITSEQIEVRQTETGWTHVCLCSTHMYISSSTYATFPLRELETNWCDGSVFQLPWANKWKGSGDGGLGGENSLETIAICLSGWSHINRKRGAVFYQLFNGHNRNHTLLLMKWSVSEWMMAQCFLSLESERESWVARMHFQVLMFPVNVACSIQHRDMKLWEDENWEPSPCMMGEIGHAHNGISAISDT